MDLESPPLGHLRWQRVVQLASTTPPSAEEGTPRAVQRRWLAESFDNAQQRRTSGEDYDGPALARQVDIAGGRTARSFPRAAFCGACLALTALWVAMPNDCPGPSPPPAVPLALADLGKVNKTGQLTKGQTARTTRLVEITFDLVPARPGRRVLLQVPARPVDSNVTSEELTTVLQAALPPEVDPTAVRLLRRGSGFAVSISSRQVEMGDVLAVLQSQLFADEIHSRDMRVENIQVGSVASLRLEPPSAPTPPPPPEWLDDLWKWLDSLPPPPPGHLPPPPPPPPPSLAHSLVHEELVLPVSLLSVALLAAAAYVRRRKRRATPDHPHCRRSAGSLKGGELSDGTDCDSSDCESRASPLKSDLTARHGRELDVVTKSLGVGPGVTDNAVDNRSSPAPRWARMMKALAHTILCLPREEQLATLTYGPSLGLL